MRGLAVWQQASINLHASLLSLPIARCCSAALDHCLQAPPELPRTVSTELTKTSGLQTALQSRSQLQQPPSQPGTLSMMDLSVICWVHGHARIFVPSRHTALVMGRAVQDATEDMARFVHPPTALATSTQNSVPLHSAGSSLMRGHRRSPARGEAPGASRQQLHPQLLLPSPQSLMHGLSRHSKQGEQEPAAPSLRRQVQLLHLSPSPHGASLGREAVSRRCQQ